MLIATTNPGKLREIRLILTGLAEPLISLADLPPVAEPAETGHTFADNALLKASYYANATGLVTLGEDSGLSIDALSGRPGVHSARYPGRTYDEKFANLFRELAHHRRPWTARFVSAVALVAPDAAQCLFRTEATVEGEIVPEPRGINGFGYDPIFFYPPYGGTLAEQTDERKLAVAHRGKAIRQLRQFLESHQPRATP